jgi:hypothetical protein
MAFAAFRRDAPDAPAPLAPCLRLALPAAAAGDPGGALVPLDCPVVSGNSGAPVLARGAAGGWQVAAVMVAGGGGGARAWAVRVPADLRARIAAAD